MEDQLEDLRGALRIALERCEVAMKTCTCKMRFKKEVGIQEIASLIVPLVEAGKTPPSLINWTEELIEEVVVQLIKRGSTRHDVAKVMGKSVDTMQTWVSRRKIRFKD